MLSRARCRAKNEGSRSTLRPVMRAAPSAGQFNKSAPSNQQDLIGEMQTNRQQEPACGKETLPGGVANQRRQVIEQRRGECLERRDKPIPDCAVRGDNGTLASLAVVRPMMGMVHPAPGALTIRRRSTLSRERAIHAVAGVRMVRTAAHREVSHKQRGGQDAKLPGHRTLCLPSIRHRRYSFTIFRRTGLPAAGGETIDVIC